MYVYVCMCGCNKAINTSAPTEFRIQSQNKYVAATKIFDGIKLCLKSLWKRKSHCLFSSISMYAWHWMWLPSVSGVTMQWTAWAPKSAIMVSSVSILVHMSSRICHPQKICKYNMVAHLNSILLGLNVSLLISINKMAYICPNKLVLELDVGVASLLKEGNVKFGLHCSYLVPLGVVYKRFYLFQNAFLKIFVKFSFIWGSIYILHTFCMVYIYDFGL